MAKSMIRYSKDNDYLLPESNDRVSAETKILAMDGRQAVRGEIFGVLLQFYFLDWTIELNPCGINLITVVSIIFYILSITSMACGLTYTLYIYFGGLLTGNIY